MNKKQSTLTSLWMDSDGDDDDCIILDPVPSTCSSIKKPDISIVKVTSAKKSNQWVAPSFGDFGDLGQTSLSKSRTALQKQKSSQQRDKLMSQKSENSTLQKINKPFSQKRSHSTLSNGSVGEFSRKTVSRRANKLPESSLWSDKYSPTVQADLAVHKKKIADVEYWIKQHVDRKGFPPILLLTGPAGVGKTATVKVLAAELGCELHEWTNPLADGFDTGWVSAEDWRSRSRLDMGPSSGSQLSQFQDFLLRANKYNTLDIFGGGVMKRKIIFVEDFPNMFYRDAAPFHDILRKYVKVGGSPLIFIVSDSSSGESNERLLFPKDLQSQLSIETISFNPVAMTSMTKILTKIATDESLKGCHMFTVPSKNVLESIAMGSAGDIRGSINALQFACLKDTGDLVLASYSKGKGKDKKGKKSKAEKKTGLSKKTFSKSRSVQKDDELAAIGGRDTSIFLFRALGKILYCKRDEPSTDTDSPVLPQHLSHHSRDPLLVNPEEVVEKCHLSGDYFSAYLHQNYVDFFSSIEDVVSASDYLSDADYLTIDWASRSVLQQYAASVATRGIIHSNTARARHTTGGGGLGWKPLHKPQWYSTAKLARQNCDSARYLFKCQISFIQEICKFSNIRSGRSEKLDEKDVELADDDEISNVATNQKPSSSQLPVDTDDVISNSQSNLKTSQEADEEYEIEDFDD